MITRRSFLKGSVAFSLSGISDFLNASEISNRQNLPFLISSGRSLDGKNKMLLYHLTNKDLLTFNLPKRGHGTTYSNQTSSFVLFDRSPGEYFLFNSLRRISNKIIKVLAPEGIHFYGHGAFSNCGKKIFVTANDLTTLEGRILVYEVTDQIKLIDNISSYGIGPHEIVRIDGTDLFWVANGGLKTHPDTQGSILNFDSIQSSLTLLNDKGDLIKSYQIPGHYQSGRHLSSKSDQIIIANQDKDFMPGVNRPIAHYVDNDQLLDLEVSSELYSKTKGYGASVCLDNKKKFAVITCPKGDLILLWDWIYHQMIHTFKAIDPAGVCFDTISNCFFITCGNGDILKLKADSKELTLFDTLDYQWDNHVQIIS